MEINVRRVEVVCPAKEFVDQVSSCGNRMIDNIHTQLDWYMSKSGWSFPLTVNDTEYSNSWVCSPYNALVDYSIEESKKVNSNAIQMALSFLMPFVARYLRYVKINKIVHLNNWMVSTNLYPDSVFQSDIEEALDFTIQKYRDKAIVLRSLNAHLNQPLIEILKQLGFIMVPTRQVYIFDKRLDDFRRKTNVRRDHKLLSSTSLKIVNQKDFNKKDLERIAELYQLLYIKKYSQHNPKYTARFIEAIAQNTAFELEGFRNENGILDAVVGRFEMAGVTSAPIVGYDTKQPQEIGLYRLAMISMLRYTERNNLIFNASSGAADFKRVRGGVPFIEYSAVYCKHMPLRTRIAWHGLQNILNGVYVPLLQKLGL